MKSLLRFLALLVLVACPALAQNNTIVTGTITFTNATGPTNGATITINGVTFTWTNSAVIPSTEILTNGTPTGAATNLFLELSTYPISTIYLLPQSSPTNVIFQTYVNGSLTMSESSPTYASLVTATTTLTNAYGVRVPIIVEPGNQQTNIASLLIKALEDSTNASTTAAYYLTNFDSLAGNQTITGSKTFTGAEVVTGTGGSLTATNVTLFNGGGTNLALTNCTLKGTLTGGTNIPNYIYAIGGSLSGIAGLPVATLTVLEDVGSDDIADFYSASHTTYFHMDGSGNLAINGSFTSTNGGTFLGNVVVANTLTASNIQNIVSAPGTNAFPAGSDISFGRFAITSLANGNNADVPTGINVFCDLSGPTGAFTINGINNPRDGRFLILLNRTGHTLTIANDSGVESTAANRIYTSTGADVVAPNSNCSAMLIYDANVSRWILLSLQ